MNAIEHQTNTPLDRLQLSPHCWMSYIPNWLAPSQADELLHALLHNLYWQAGRVRIFGKMRDIPRLHAWYGDEGVSYGWSGQRSQPLPWSNELQSLRDQLQQDTGEVFNGVLANLYRDGQDCMHWHADDERELGSEPLIAAISVGAERRFSIRHNRREQATHRLHLAHGSLLLMGGDTQNQWQHTLPRSKGINQPRVSLTYRQIRQCL